MKFEDLPLETQFDLKAFPARANQMETEAIKHMLVRMYEQMFYQENKYKKLIAEQWGIGDAT